jgi:hypothetical protein
MNIRILVKCFYNKLRMQRRLKKANNILIIKKELLEFITPIAKYYKIYNVPFLIDEYLNNKYKNRKKNNKY